MKERRQTSSAPAYPKNDRKTDVRNGRRDGRKQLPAYGEVVELVNTGTEVSTPYQKMLISLGRHRIHDEYEAFLRGVDGYLSRRADLISGLGALQRQERNARNALTVAREELTDAELRPRSPHELAMNTPELHGRRATMREHRIARADRNLARRTAAVDDRQKEIREISGTIDKSFANAQENGRKLADYFVLRIATYWDALVQTHPEGRNLASLLRPATFPLPDWVEAMCWVGDVAPLLEEVTP